MWRPRISRLLSTLGLLALTTSPTALAANGDSFCGTLVCTTATISGAQTIYTLNTTVQFSDLGWMAIGFGQSMIGSPLVILWPNADGSVTLSQRQATAHAEPQIVANPAAVATLRTDLSSLTGGAITLSFIQQSSGQTSQNMIYALGRTRPSSNDPAARLVQHAVTGQFTLDLTKTVADVPSVSASATASGTATGGSSATSVLPLPTQTSGSSNDPFASIPYTPAEKKILAHGILSALGFCFFLPIGVLQARFLRIWWPRWFKTHWIVQAGLAGPFIVAGFALGVSVVADSKGAHFDDKHMVIGLILFILYICQALYGFIIHIVKSPNRKRRPIQNYGHAIVGLALISLALYQVWLGFNYEWSYVTGRDQPSEGVRIFWIIWVAVLGAAYVVGLALLPKQYRVESYMNPDIGKSSDDDVKAIPSRRN